jgi:hypothetical protein
MSTKKFSLRISGARPGSAVRPDEAPSVALPLIPTRRLGLKVHTSKLAAPAALSPDDYATAEDYE